MGETKHLYCVWVCTHTPPHSCVLMYVLCQYKTCIHMYTKIKYSFYWTFVAKAIFFSKETDLLLFHSVFIHAKVMITHHNDQLPWTVQLAKSKVVPMENCWCNRNWQFWLNLGHHFHLLSQGNLLLTINLEKNLSENTWIILLNSPPPQQLKYLGQNCRHKQLWWPLNGI